MSEQKNIQTPQYLLGIDIGSTTVKIAILDGNITYCFRIISVILQIFRNTLADLLD